MLSRELLTWKNLPELPSGAVSLDRWGLACVVQLPLKCHTTQAKGLLPAKSSHNF